MRAAGIAFKQQVRIPGVGRVDFLVEDRLILEVDSMEFHDEPSHRIRDLRRDAHATVLDLRSLRLDYQQVLFDWEFSEVAIRAALAHRPGRVAIGG
jgi:very-short-patch-repair endonuclease